jgi:putative DNA primase/helicase
MQATDSPQAHEAIWNIEAGHGGCSLDERIRRCLDSCHPAISGEKGHDKLLFAAGIGPGFALTENQTFEYLVNHYNQRCQPPWLDKDIWHKVREAFRLNDRPLGYLRDARSATVSKNGTTHNGHGSTTKPSADTQHPSEPRAPLPLTDLGNAERLVRHHGDSLRFCHPWGKWLTWDGRRWATDRTGAARSMARQTVRLIASEAAGEANESRREALLKWALASEKRDRISAALHLAEVEPGIPILPDALNANPWAFNCTNGTIDLQTGRLLPHRREDFITQLCAIEFDPDALCPLWDATLSLFLRENAGLIDYLQRLCGCALAGIVRDHIMPVFYGTGANGKSTILGTLLDVLGPDYAMKCPPDMLMARRGDSHPTDRADLFSKRLVVAIESEANRRLNETLVKELTGGDAIRARRMREDFWEFRPTHTLFMATNHRPQIRGRDNGMWRRLKLFPFTVTVDGARADKTMPEKLRSEFQGILAWCVRGCLEWQRRGLEAPDEVKDATESYRREQDVIGAFLEEFTVWGPKYRTRASELYARYKAWAEAGSEYVVTQTAFGLALQELGFEKRSSNGTWYLGIGLDDSAAVITALGE